MSNSFIRPKKVALCTAMLLGITSASITPAMAVDEPIVIDTEAPSLESFEVTPELVDGREGGTLTVSMHVTDDTGLDGEPDISVWNSADNVYESFVDIAVTRVSGSSQDGHYEANINISASDFGTQPFGTWEITMFPLSDTLNNSGSFTTLPFTYAVTPGTPTNVEVSSAIFSDLSATWDAPNAYGSAIDHYVGTILNAGTDEVISTFESNTTSVDASDLELALDTTYALSIVAVNGVGESTAGLSAEFEVDAATPATSVPTISGPAYVGKTLTADAGDWGPEPIELSYQWLRDGSPISGATNSTYQLAAADEGAQLVVAVTGTKAGYTTTTTISEKTAKIASADDDAPVVTASLEDGMHLFGSKIELSANGDASIYYTIDGTDPTVDSEVYKEPIELEGRLQLKYIGVDDATNVSDIATRNYTLDFTDVFEGDEDTKGTLYFEEIRWAVEQEISKGWPDGTFRPYDPINRDAMAAFLYRLAGEPAFEAPEVSPFVDYNSDNQFYGEVTWLYEQGITTGWTEDEEDTTVEYRAFENINRDAMAVFLYRFAGSPEFGAPEESPFVDYNSDNLYYDEVTWLYEQGITTGWTENEADTTVEFRAFTGINRDAMAAFMFRYNNIFDIL